MKRVHLGCGGNTTTFLTIVNYVTIGNVRASEQAVEHLKVGLGYRRIANFHYRATGIFADES